MSNEESKNEFTYEEYSEIIENGEFNLTPIDIRAITALTLEGLNFEQVIETVKERNKNLWSYKTTFIYLMHNGDHIFLSGMSKCLDSAKSTKEIEEWIHANKNEKCEIGEVLNSFPNTYDEEEKQNFDYKL